MNTSHFGRGLACAILMSMALGLGVTATAEDWPVWRGPSGNGISAEADWSPEAVSQAKVLWRANVGKGYSSFAVANGKVYTMGNTDEVDSVVCLDVKTGEEVWRDSYPCRAGQYKGPRGTPTVDGKLLFAVDRLGRLRCWDAETGKPKWEKQSKTQMPRWGIASSPIVHDGLVVVNAGTSGTAFKTKNGAVAWSGGGGLPGYASPVLRKTGSKTEFLVFSGKGLVCVNAKSGRPRWTFPWETKYSVNAGDPVLVGEDRVFISSGYGKGCAMLKLTSRDVGVVWQNTNMKNHMASSVYHDGHLYGFDDARRGANLTCLDAETGERKWSQQGFGKGALVLADGKLIFLTERGIHLIVAEATPEAYKEIARAQVLDGHTWTSPVLANGRIYCRNDAGDVACVDVSVDVSAD